MSDDFGMSGDDLEQMYQEVILEAARDPHGKAHFVNQLLDFGDFDLHRCALMDARMPSVNSTLAAHCAGAGQWPSQAKE